MQMASCGREENDVDLKTPTGSKQQNKGKRKEVESADDDDDVEIPTSRQQKKKGQKKEKEGDSGSKEGVGCLGFGNTSSHRTRIRT